MRIAADRSRRADKRVKFLVDNQLPEALGRFLNARGHEAGHVLDLSMEEVSVLEIWNYAASGNWIVVSKDQDFGTNLPKYLEATVVTARA